MLITSRAPRRATLKAGLMAGLFLLPGTNSAVAQTSTAQAAPSAPRYGGELLFTDVILTPSWLRSAASTYAVGNVMHQLLDRLVYQNDQGEIVAWLASAFSVNDAGTEFTFTLRKGVSFSDGTPLTAAVVKANLDQLGLGDEKKGFRPGFEFSGYERTDVVDADTVKVVLKEANSYFLVGLTTPNTGIVAASTLDKDVKGQARPENIIGTGPFVFKSEIPKREIVLTRREDYAWPPQGASNKGKAYLDRVIYREITEEGLRTGALRSNQAHLVKGIQPADEAGLEKDGFVIYGQRPILNVVDQISVRAKNPLVADEKVRRALSIGINRRELVDTVLSKSYHPATGLLIRTAPGHTSFDSELAFDPKKANQLLDEAGWVKNGKGIREKNGQDLRLTVGASTQSSAIRPALEFVAQQWRELGVILINRAGDDTYFNQMATDPAGPLRAYRPSLSGGLGGIFGYLRGQTANNLSTLTPEPGLEELFREELRTIDAAKRTELLHRIQRRLVVDLAYSIPLFEASQTYGAPANVKVRFSSNTLPFFQETWIDAKR